ncbi:ATP-binding cassette domain-containing protein [Streptomyces sp. NPDC012389]|uniref:ATP-binding cassette domain-containing protein n=1 Tax=unclassified Streptomyces TaxID=2593676 RepID=UPI00081E0F2E|nr:MULTISPECIES: ATP-binding cassette domain-containing protein [unclassified Streptomyces]MYR94589.1 ATP-binding cassette domain-containing protein [Streptomyces sp. SID4937]MYX18056.1 ATP-binding cassette domain-containing protein [Streptomyces sp. SID8374]SCD74012.1 nodulation factor export ABC transporter ATP-binding protein NodI [Streptomyces sp. ScaeMP-e83]
MTEAIALTDLTKRFGEHTALDQVSLRIPTGTVVGLLGPNGAGKTTLINCLTTLLRPDGGTIRVLGHDPGAEPSLVRANIAVTGQFAALDEQISPHENLVFFGRLLGLSRGGAQQRAGEMLERFELSEAARAPVGYLSGGMRRRLDLAVSLVVPRPVLVLDEPTTGLDPRSRKLLWDMVRDEAARGVAVLLTTQYLEEADQLADRIVVIDKGKVLADGSSDELKREVGGVMCRLTMTSGADTEAVRLALSDLPGVATEGDKVTVPMSQPEDLGTVIGRVDRTGLRIADIEVTRPTLDEVFFALTEPLEKEATR